MTPHTIPNDWLLQAGRIGALAIRVILWIGMAAMVLGFAFVIFGSAADFAEIDAELARESVGTSGRIALALIFAFILALLALYERLIERLQRIIESVGAGDPFAPENADRLGRMGWLLLAAQVLGFCAMTINAIQALSDDWDFSSEFSLEGLFAVVVLFILARVFRHGAAMREDLEGTV